MSLKGTFKKFGRSDNGTVAISFGLAALVLFMAAGAAIDYGRWQAQASQLQGVADAAVLAGAQKLAVANVTQNTVAKAVQAYVNPNGSGLEHVRVDSVEVDTTAKTVAAKISMPATRTLSALMLTKDPIISVQTKVSYSFAPKGMAICLWALDPTLSGALAGSGGGTRVNAPGCTIRVNSTNASSVNFSGGSSVAAGENCFEGGIGQGAAYITPTPKKCGTLTDPFSSISLPAIPTTCAARNSFSGTATINPGLYCGGLTVSSGTFTFNPGLYIIKDGVFTASGGSTLRGAGVTFLLTGTNAGITWSGGSGVYDFKAMNTGPLASFVVYLDPRATPASKSVVSGGGGTKFEGIMYLPTQRLEMSGGSTATGFTVFIAKNFLFSGGSQFNVAVDRSMTSLPIPAAVAGSSGSNGVRLIN